MVASAAIKATLSLAAGLSRRPTLVILTYHRVLAAPDPFLSAEPDAALFRFQMEFLARHLRVLPLREAVAQLVAGTLPRRAVCVTFDDGYANNHQVALPILRQVGVPATFFIATGYLDGGCMWNDAVVEALRRCRADVLDLSSLGLGQHEPGDTGARRGIIRQLLGALKYRPLPERTELAGRIAGLAGVELPRDLMMTSGQVAELHHQGMEIGGHTINHPILARIPDAEARQEIAGGRARLAAITGAAPACFAYPNGRPGEDYLERHAGMVAEAGFELALSTRPGCATGRSPVYELPRVSVWSREPARLAANLCRIYGREILGGSGEPSRLPLRS